ncbi:MAG: glycosyl hydrolase 108 family protein [Candidatus Thiodiazotropha taylori]
MSTRHFTVAAKYLLSIEGGYVNHPADKGGETNYGISKMEYPDLDIKSLSKDQALEIYRADYWDSINCDHLPGQIAVVLFDAAVHHGQWRAVTLLQQELGVRADGINGPITQAAARNAYSGFIADFLARRARHYTDITLADSSQAVFLKGWFRRLFLLQFKIIKYAEVLSG